MNLYFLNINPLVPRCNIRAWADYPRFHDPSLHDRLLCYVWNADVEKTRHFHIFPHVIPRWLTHINTKSVPRRVLIPSTCCLVYIFDLCKKSAQNLFHEKGQEISSGMIVNSIAALLNEGVTIGKTAKIGLSHFAWICIWYLGKGC